MMVGAAIQSNPMSSSGSVGSKSKSSRISSLSLSNGASSAAIASLKMERNLLERMVQERDEKISSLQKSIEVQTEHVNKLQAKIEINERRQKQIESRHKLKLDNMEHEKNMLKSQLKVMHEELKRISNDPVHNALSSAASKGSDGSVNLSQMMPAGNPFGAELEQDPKRAEKIKLANSAQGVLLQQQLYQAMNSLMQLREQTAAMKENYDEIVTSLQKDLVFAQDAKASTESELLSQISLLDQQRVTMEKALQHQLAQKDVRIKRLEKRLRKLDNIDDDEDEDIEYDDDTDHQSKDSFRANGQLSFKSIGSDTLGSNDDDYQNYNRKFENRKQQNEAISFLTRDSNPQNKSIGLLDSSESELRNPYSMATNQPFKDSKHSFSPSSRSVGSRSYVPSSRSVGSRNSNGSASAASSTRDSARLLLEQSRNRAAALLQQHSLRSRGSSNGSVGSASGRPRRRSTYTAGTLKNALSEFSIQEEDEDGDNDDARSVVSHISQASEAASMASNLLKESRMRALKLLSKSTPAPPTEITQVQSSDSDGFGEIVHIPTTESDDLDLT